jgi:choline dehydrogenase-like flavoprotein
VTDGSVFPTSAGVNPSLTIAANALRVGREIARSAVPLLAAAGAEER